MLIGGQIGCSALEGLFKDSKKKEVPVEEEAGPDEVEGADGVYGGVREAHYLAKVLDEGATLVLDDGSVWKVEARDQMFSAGWTAMQDVVVHDLSSPPHYRLVNATAREEVTAVYLGTPREL